MLSFDRNGVWLQSFAYPEFSPTTNRMVSIDAHLQGAGRKAAPQRITSFHRFACATSPQKISTLPSSGDVRTTMEYFPESNSDVAIGALR